MIPLLIILMFFYYQEGSNGPGFPLLIFWIYLNTRNAVQKAFITIKKHYFLENHCQTH